MSDIVERLRDPERYVDAVDEAARLIERQRIELEALRAVVDAAGKARDLVMLHVPEFEDLDEWAEFLAALEKVKK